MMINRAPKMQPIRTITENKLEPRLHMKNSPPNPIIKKPENQTRQKRPVLRSYNLWLFTVGFDRNVLVPPVADGSSPDPPYGPKSLKIRPFVRCDVGWPDGVFCCALLYPETATSIFHIGLLRKCWIFKCPGIILGSDGARETIICKTQRKQSNPLPMQLLMAIV